MAVNRDSKSGSSTTNKEKGVRKCSGNYVTSMGGGYLALALVVAVGLVSVGYGWIVDRAVATGGNYYDTLYPSTSKLMYVGAYAGASAIIEVDGESLATGQQFWTSFCHARAENGVFNCANGTPPGPATLTQYQLRTNLITAGASFSHGYAWQAPDVSPHQCANGNGN